MRTYLKANGKITFFKDGKQCFDFTIKGNIVKFSDGQIILI
jgi:hypothetical protein